MAREFRKYFGNILHGYLAMTEADTKERRFEIAMEMLESLHLPLGIEYTGEPLDMRLTQIISDLRLISDDLYI